ncbi:hypothetical protein F8S13_03980 [Chloroflexia bacterium SDU3-3]|nr:hypothetical protein F8S13_03980 [Chloroflexia bacterium SDU3-3]
MRRHTPIRLAIMALALLAALLPQRSPARSQDVFHLLKDMNPGSVARATKPQDTAVLGDAVYFITDSRPWESNAQLWRTDGTDTGTTMIMDFPIGEFSVVYQLQSAGGHLYFLADSSFYGIELWTSDGTEASTHMVANITPSYDDSFMNYGADIDIDGHFPGAALGGLFYFSPDNLELWSTDGTEAGTKKVLSPSGGVANLRVVDGKLFILNGNFTELWVSDATEAGTQKLADFSSSFQEYFAANNSYLTPYNGKNYFLDDGDDSNSVNLWATDGTPAGTSIIANMPAYTSLYGINLSIPIVVSNKLAFLVDGISNTELWTSDGTTAGTAAVTSLPNGYFSAPLVVNGTMLFTISPYNSSQAELWASNGTAAGTKLVTTLDTKSTNFKLRALGDKAILCADTCWSSDGTAAGTTPIADGAALWLYAASELGGALIAPIKSGSATSLMARTDGTVAGTSQFFSASQPANSSVLGTPVLGDTRYIVTPTGLWETDGTTAGTQEHPGILSKLPSNASIVAINQIQSALILQERHWDGKNYIFGIWRTDGTVEGTSLITSIGTDIVVPSLLPMVVAGNVLYVIDAQNNLWSSDGTPEGSKQIISSMPNYNSLLAVGTDLLIIESNFQTNVTRISKVATDRSTLVEIMPSGNYNWRNPNVIGKSAYWNISSGGKVEQWRYDQGASKPVLASSITTALTVYTNRMFNWNNKLTYMLEGDTNSELWQSTSGTAAPTKLLDIPHAVSTVIAAGPYIYFEAEDYVEAEGYIKRQVWRTDGTAEGTVLLQSTSHIRETYINLQKAVGSTLYFSIYMPDRGSELWSSDGTAAGTKLYTDINPGAAGSDPEVLLELGGALLVQATTASYGRELYLVDIPVGSERLYLPLAQQ